MPSDTELSSMIGTAAASPNNAATRTSTRAELPRDADLPESSKGAVTHTAFPLAVIDGQERRTTDGFASCSGGRSIVDTSCWQVGVLPGGSTYRHSRVR
jgi:hypothetical protein